MMACKSNTTHMGSCIRRSVLIVSLCLLPALIMLFAGGCTHCDGDIGSLFGSWHIEKIIVDGEEEADYDGSLAVSFQGEICNVAYLSYDYDRYDLESYGTWSRSDNRLTITLGYQNRDTSLFNPFPPAMCFPDGERSVTVDIMDDDGRHMKWRYVTDEGTTVDYILRKYP